MDAFYASIEQRDNPVLRGKPVIVGAPPDARGVVSAASYEARRFGVRSAMPSREAYRRCPDGVFVRPRMAVYERESQHVMAILREFSPELEQISVDEAFLDITGTERLLGPPLDVAGAIGKAIRERRDITASIGIAPNKYLAKLASDMHKPDGITVVPEAQAEIEAWLAPLPAGKIWGVGKKTEAVLAGTGVRTVGDLQAYSRERLAELFGEWGQALHDLARGIDNREVQTEADAARSISREHTFGSDTADREELERTLLSLSHEVAREARQTGMKGRTVVLIYRLSDFNKHTRRTTLAAATDLGKTLYEQALKLLAAIRPGTPVRLIGVGLTGFGEAAQTELFGEERDARWQMSEKAVDRLAEKFGDEIVVRGREVEGRRARRTTQKAGSI